jgi:hypothetical protein
MKIIGKPVVKFFPTKSYGFSGKNLCARAGLFGFICDKEKWRAYSNINTNDPGNLKCVDTVLSLCLRVYPGDLKGKLKIPQLALYPPVTGYPSCMPEFTTKFKQSLKWPYSYEKHFMVIPMLHVNYGLLYGKCLNNYSLFFSNNFEENYPLDTFDGMSKIGNYWSYSTGINHLDSKKLNECPATWPEDMDLTDDDDLDLYFCSTAYTSGLMDYDAFHRYLAYWMLYYPLGFRKIRGYPYGCAGNLTGPFQGYLHYFSDRDDTFTGEGRVWKMYYGISKDMSLKQEHASGFQGTSFTFSDFNKFGSQNYQMRYMGVKDELLHEMAVIRAAIIAKGKRKQFSNYPFKSQSKRWDLGRSMIEESVLRKLSFISNCRYKMTQAAKTTEIKDKKCPSCSGKLYLPKILSSSTEKNNVVCIICGYKALANIHFLAAKTVNSKEINCMYYHDIDMESIVGKTEIESGLGESSNKEHSNASA